MKRGHMPYAICYLLGLSGLLLLTGCVVRTYPVTKDRLDQDLTTGNRGYLKGEMPSEPAKERKTTRTTQVVEIELYSPVKLEKTPKVKPAETKIIQKTREEDQPVWGNRGFISQTETPEVAEPKAKFERYTVQKGDTLQKISRKFYGTTKKWNKIYQANQDTLKGPDKVYPGQVINIPVEELMETPGNLK